MTSVVKVLFALYAFYAAFVSLSTAFRYPTKIFWLWAAVTLCFLPVAWGLIRERKWAWNCAVGLVIFRFCWAFGQQAALFLPNTLDRTSVAQIVLRNLALSVTSMSAILILLISVRRTYQSASADGDTKQNNYVRPVSVGVIFLLMGLTGLLHPSVMYQSPIALRLIGFTFAVFLWVAAGLCFFERPWEKVRLLAKIATVTAAIAAIFSLSFYSYFALLGLIVGGVQVLLGSVAIVAAKNSVSHQQTIAAG